MSKTLLYITFTISLLTIFPKNIAAQFVADHSATINISINKQNSDLRKLYTIKRAIKIILIKNNSPLINNIPSFISTCLKYNLDCYFLPAIAGLESSYGKYIYPNSYNPFGWGGGYINFSSWDEAIEQVGQKIKENYIDKGLTDIYSIGKIYSNSPTWAERISLIINNFKIIEQQQFLLLETN
ncbi:MAG: hypothetical protein ACPL1D_01370 [Microgenomates group bacterium]